MPSELPEAVDTTRDDAPDMRRPTVAHRLEAFGLRLVEGIIGLIGIDRASALSGRLWRLAAPHTRRHARVLAHLAMAMPETTPAERARIADRVWDNLGRVFVEALDLGTIVEDPGRIAYGDIDVVRRVAGTGRGAVLVSLHLGNWELCTSALIKLGLKPAAVYQELSNPLVEARLREARLPWYPGGLHARRKSGNDVARKLLKHVRDGGVATLLADLRDGKGAQVPFFGRLAWATLFPATVARSLGVPLVVGRMVRADGVSFRLDAMEVPVARTDDRDADILAATVALHEVFEAWIREHPEQWLWTHRKWAPPGDKTRLV